MNRKKYEKIGIVMILLVVVVGMSGCVNQSSDSNVPIKVNVESIPQIKSFTLNSPSCYNFTSYQEILTSNLPVVSYGNVRVYAICQFDATYVKNATNAINYCKNLASVNNQPYATGVSYYGNVCDEPVSSSDVLGVCEICNAFKIR